jgi:glycosyltransferase involved in cell wall biosynthesis
MRILAVMHDWDPTARDGGQFGPRATLTQIAEFAQVDVLTVSHDPTTLPPLDGPFHVTAIPRRPFGRLAQIAGPLPTVALWARGLDAERRIAEMITATSCDAVLVGGPTYTGVLLPDHVDARLVYLTANLEWDRLRSFAGLQPSILRRGWTLLQSRRMRRLERRLLRRADAIIAVSAQEVAPLRELAGPKPTVLLAPIVPDQSLLALPISGRPPATVLFIGALDYTPNIVAARTLAAAVMPKVRQSHPDAALIIAGSRPTEQVRSLERDGAGVRLLADFESQRDVFALATVFAAPLNSQSGVSIKALHALASGTPLVASPAVLRSVGAQEGVHARVARSPNEFASEISSLLADVSAREALATAGRAFVAHAYSPPASQAALRAALTS